MSTPKLVLAMASLALTITGCAPQVSISLGPLGPVSTSTGTVATAPTSTSPLTGGLTTSFVPTSTTGSTTTGSSTSTGTGTTTTTGTAQSSGSSAENVAALAAAGVLQSGGKSNDGRLTFTQYGGPSDRTPDSNTSAGIGNRGNTLGPTSIALSPNLIREYGLSGGEPIFLVTNGQKYFLGTYDDTTGNNSEDNVIDVYDPQDRLGADSFMRNVPAGQWKLEVGSSAA